MSFNYQLFNFHIVLISNIPEYERPYSSLMSFLYLHNKKNLNLIYINVIIKHVVCPLFIVIVGGFMTYNK